MSEKLYSKTETRKRLGVGRTRYAQMIESGILAQPIVLASGGRAVHTESQIGRVETNLYDKASREYLEIRRRQVEDRVKPMKPLSKKLVGEMR